MKTKKNYHGFPDSKMFYEIIRMLLKVLNLYLNTAEDYKQGCCLRKQKLK